MLCGQLVSAWLLQVVEMPGRSWYCKANKITVVKSLLCKRRIVTVGCYTYIVTVIHSVISRI